MNESIERLAAAGFVETLSLVAQRRRSLAQNKLDERSAVLGELRDWAREVGGASRGGRDLLGADRTRDAGVEPGLLVDDGGDEAQGLGGGGALLGKLAGARGSPGVIGLAWGRHGGTGPPHRAISVACQLALDGPRREDAERRAAWLGPRVAGNLSALTERRMPGLRSYTPRESCRKIQVNDGEGRGPKVCQSLIKGLILRFLSAGRFVRRHCGLALIDRLFPGWPGLAASGRAPVTALLVLFLMLAGPGAAAKGDAESDRAWRKALDTGRALTAQQRYRQAENAIVASLERARKFGPGGPREAFSLTALAQLYESSGNDLAADRLYRDAVSIFETALGADHPQVGRAHLNLAEFLRSRRLFQEAESSYERWIAMMESTAKPPAAIKALRQLALTYFFEGRHGKAIDFLERAHSLAREHLGPRHAETAECLNAMGVVQAAAGSFVSSETLFREALSIREEALGPRHELVAATLEQLAEIYRERLQFAEAEKLVRRSIDITKDHLPKDHPRVAKLLNDLGEIYSVQRESAQAERIFRLASRIWDKAESNDDPEMATTFYNLAVLRQEGGGSEVGSLFERPLTIFEKLLGPDHPKTTAVAGAYAEWLRAQGRKRDATRIERDFDEVKLNLAGIGR